MSMSVCWRVCGDNVCKFHREKFRQTLLQSTAALRRTRVWGFWEDTWRPGSRSHPMWERKVIMANGDVIVYSLSQAWNHKMVNLTSSLQRTPSNDSLQKSVCKLSMLRRDTALMNTASTSFCKAVSLFCLWWWQEQCSGPSGGCHLMLMAWSMRTIEALLKLQHQLSIWTEMCCQM